MEQLYSRRRHERYDICLPATLEMQNSSISCQTRNISAGGASLIFPFDAGLYDLRSAHGLQIKEIAFFGVTLIWQSNNLCGLKFEGSDGAKRKMRDYIADHCQARD